MSKKTIVFIDFQSILRDTSGRTNPLYFIKEVISSFGTIDGFKKCPSGDEADFVAVFDSLSHKEKEIVLPSYKATLKVTFLNDYLNEQVKLKELLPLCGFKILSSSMYECSDIIFSETKSILESNTYQNVVIITGDFNLLQVLNVSERVSVTYFGDVFIAKPKQMSIRDFSPILPFYIALKGDKYLQLDGFNLQYESRYVDWAVFAFNCYTEKKGDTFIQELYNVCSYKNIPLEDIKAKYETNLLVTKLWSIGDSPFVKRRGRCTCYDDFRLMYSNIYGYSISNYNDNISKELFTLFSGVKV